MFATLDLLIATLRGLTQQGSFPPVPIPNLDVVVPAEAAFIQIHGGEVQDDLEDKGEVLYSSHEPCVRVGVGGWVCASPFLQVSQIFSRRSACMMGIH